MSEIADQLVTENAQLKNELEYNGLFIDDAKNHLISPPEETKVFVVVRGVEYELPFQMYEAFTKVQETETENAQLRNERDFLKRQCDLYSEIITDQQAEIDKYRESESRRHPPLVKLLPCKCGCKRRPVSWFTVITVGKKDINMTRYMCDECGLVGRYMPSERQAREEWNGMVTS